MRSTGSSAQPLREDWSLEDSTQRLRGPVALSGALITAGVFAIDYVIPTGYAGGMPYIIPVLLGLWAGNRYVVSTALAATGLTLVGLYVPVNEAEISWTAYLNRFGALVSIWVTAAGVLLYRRTARALESNEARTRAILQSTADAIVTIDEHGTISSWNRGAERIFGRDAADALGRSVNILLPATERERHDGYLQRYLHGGDARAFGSGRELLAVRADGTEFPIELSLSEVRMPEARWFTGVIRDITERKQAQATRDALMRELERKNAELERFTYTVSHDLKSPLITIKGFVGMIERDVVAGRVERVTSDLSRIGNAAEHMKALLDDLLELSRIGRMVSVPEDISLGELARETAALLAGPLSERGAKLVIDDALPTVRGDRRRIGEVLQNLVENAIKFAGERPHPRIEIGAREGGGEQVIFVRDDGVGIDPKYHDKVFGLFEKVDARAEGTGIGLALVKRIVEVHGGRTWVESEGPGTGSCFCFTFGRAAEPAATSRGNHEAAA